MFICSDFIKKFELNLKRNIRNKGVFGRKGVRGTDARKRLFLKNRRAFQAISSFSSPPAGGELNIFQAFGA